MGEAPEVSVVIACSRPARLEPALGALAAQPAPWRAEVIVAGDVPRTTGSWPFDVTLLRCDEPHPNARRNEGVARARAPRLAFLDDDAEPAVGWLDAACAVDPGAAVLMTGPELPLRGTRGARLAYEVLASPLGEVGGGHHHARGGAVRWYQVPFCNLVTTRSLWERLGPLPTDVPWDCDDFELADRARALARFVADPELRVRHDRYPDRARDLVAAIWKKRVRTGAKLVELPGIYWRVPSVALCALSPLSLLVPAAPAAFAVVYAALLARGGLRARRALGAGAGRRFVLLTLGVHAATVLGVHWGLTRALASRLGGVTWS